MSDKCFAVVEVGIYTTRNGREVYVSHVDKYRCCGIVCGECEASEWDKNGKITSEDYADFDIVKKGESQ